MLPKGLEIECPSTLREALNLLKNKDGNFQIIAGGTDVIPHIKSIGKFLKFMDISLLKSELCYIKEEKGDLRKKNLIRIGALTTHSKICRSNSISSKIPVLAQACRQVGSKQIRNRGTIGGNLVNASPAGDTLPVLLALDAKVKLVSSEKTREMDLKKFFVDAGKTVLEQDEILSEIIIPLSDNPIKGIYRKLGSRNALTIAIASVAVIISEKQKSVSYGALAPTPIRAYQLEDVLLKDTLPPWDELKNIIFDTVNPISDVRASGYYRKEMASNLTYMCLKELDII